MVLINIKNKGYTIIEILAAVAIFSLILGAVIGVFISALKSQRKVLADQELLDQASYVLEYMSRSLRMAKKDLGPDCLSLAKLNYEKTSSGTGGIKFKNYLGDYCQEFFREWDGTKYRLKEWKKEISTGQITTDYLTSPNFNVNFFNIGPDDSWDENDNFQPVVTIFLDITGKEQSNIKIQTTISQRDLDM